MSLVEQRKIDEYIKGSAVMYVIRVKKVKAKNLENKILLLFNKQLNRLELLHIDLFVKPFFMISSIAYYPSHLNGDDCNISKYESVYLRLWKICT